MSQTLPEVLDYRNLMEKLAHLDGEWESLKTMLAFRTPYKDAEPANSHAADNEFPLDQDNRVVEFPKLAPNVKTQEGCDRVCNPWSAAPWLLLPVNGRP
jgi:hypothetical protein